MKRNDLKLEVVLSVLNLDKKNLKKMNITSDCTIINQCGKNGYEKYKNYSIYSYDEIGVSNSRNRGLEHASDDIILFCDDDIVYVDNYEELILNEFNKNLDADIIIFNIDSDNRKIKKNKNNKRIHIYNGLGFSSNNIAVRRNSVIGKINFNTLFGPGGIYSHGEDTLFIVDDLKKGLKVYGVNVLIGNASNSSSTWFKGYDEKYFFDKGALFTCISKRFRHLLFVQYLLRHRGVCNNINMFNAYRIMLKGSKDYLDRGV